MDILLKLGFYQKLITKKLVHNKTPWEGIVKPINTMNNLGRHGKDVITGFEGTITSAHFYLTGCTQYGLAPKAKGDGTLGEVNYFDKTRVEVSGEPIQIIRSSEGIDDGCDSRERP